MGDVIQLPEVRRRIARYRRVIQLLETGMDLCLRDEVEPIDLTEHQAEYPRWSAGIRQMDELTGGFQATSYVAADKGRGKSILALGAGVASAQDNVCTLYFDAENGPGLIRKRLLRRFSGRLEELADIINVSFFYLPVGPRDRLPTITRAALAHLHDQHEGLLLILDSFNSVIETLMPTGNPFDNQQRFLAWLDWLVRESGGFVRVLLVSELNKDGHAKGRKIDYRSSVALHLRQLSDEGFDVIEVFCEKNRDGPAGKVGVFTLNWLYSRFDWLRP